MPEAALSGAEFKKQLRAGTPKMGLFLNAHSPTVAEQLAHSGYDWLLVDTQHGPMHYEKLSAMLSGIANGGAKSWCALADTMIVPASSRRSIWVPTAFLFPTSTPPKKRARRSAARSIRRSERARCIFRSAA